MVGDKMSTINTTYPLEGREGGGAISQIKVKLMFMALNI